MMALKVKAVERLVKFNKGEDADVYRYVMNPELYIALSLAKSDPRSSSPLGRSKGQIDLFEINRIYPYDVKLLQHQRIKTELLLQRLGSISYPQNKLVLSWIYLYGQF